jgi:uncharacterized membrane protein
MRVASIVFALVCLAQLLRLVLRIEVIAGGHYVPFWVSGVALVVTGSLSLWLWMFSKA